MKKSVFLFFAAMLLVLTSNSFAAKISDGYEDLKWGAHVQKIIDAYPKGQKGEFSKEIIYTQDNPDETIASRLFAFKDGKLVSVAVTFDGKYVTKIGLENLKQKYVKQYGNGKPEKHGKSAHMVSYKWEGKRTRITFIFVPNRPEMTVLQFEKK